MKGKIMQAIRTYLLLLLTSSGLFAKSVDISGTVLNYQSIPSKAAIIRLSVLGDSTFTDSLGHFRLQREETKNAIVTSVSLKSNITICDMSIRLPLQSSVGNLRIYLLDISGRILFNYSKKNVHSGIYNIPLYNKYRQLTTGIYYLQIKCDDEKSIFRFLNLSGVMQVLTPAKQNEDLHQLPKESGKAFLFDTLVIYKAGCQQTRITINSYYASLDTLYIYPDNSSKIHFQPHNGTVDSGFVQINDIYHKVRYAAINDSTAIVQGDMLFLKRTVLTDTLLGLKKKTKSWGFQKGGLWPCNTVPFIVDGTLPNAGRLYRALKEFSATNVSFRYKQSGDIDYVRFVRDLTLPNGQCWSWVGKIGGGQEIHIADWASPGDIIHEIGHALGLLHEHARPDRNQYVVIHPENVDPAICGSACILTNFLGQDIGPIDEPCWGPFDYSSIMMYAPTAGAVSVDKPTLVNASTGMPYSYQNSYLSIGDLKGLKCMYAIIKPDAAFTATPISGPAPLTVHFNAQDNNPCLKNITSWNWDFGNGVQSTLQNPIYTYSMPGQYKVKLIGLYAGMYDTATNIISVIDTFHAGISAVVDNSASNLTFNTGSCISLFSQPGIWYATKGDGLYFYQNGNWVIYTMYNSCLPSNSILALRLSSDGINIETSSGNVLLTTDCRCLKLIN